MAMLAALGLTTFWFWFYIESAWLAVASIVGCAIIWSGHRTFIKKNPDMFRNAFALFGLLSGSVGVVNGAIATIARFVI
jgi:hypothetical protein